MRQRATILEYYQKDIEEFLRANAEEYYKDPMLDSGSIRMLLMDDFMDHVGHTAHAGDYEDLISQLASGNLHEEKLSSRNPSGRGVEEPLSAVIEPTEEDDPAGDSDYMSHVKHHFEENKVRSIIRNVLINERMESDIYKVVVQNIHRNGPMDHQELLRKVLGNFPMLSDEEIDGYIDDYADTGAILYDPNMQKYY